MQELTLEQMELVEGGGFWKGVTCGFTAAATVAALLSPDPISKLGLYSLGMGWAACFV